MSEFNHSRSKSTSSVRSRRSSKSSAFDHFSGGSTSSYLLGWNDTNKKDDGMRCIFIPKNIIICYGPYMVQGILDYRTERLLGLLNSFYKLGVIVTLKRAHHLNLLKIWYMDSMIFSCKMGDLQYGGDGSLDGKCKQAIKVFQVVFHKAAHEMRLRQKQQIAKAKENDICRFCACGQRNNNTEQNNEDHDHDDRVSISNASVSHSHVNVNISKSVINSSSSHSSGMLIR